MVPRSIRSVVLAVSLLPLGLAACSGTWEGAKQDTRENVKATGQGIEKAGEKI